MAHLSVGDVVAAPLDPFVRLLNNLLRRALVGDDGLTDLEREVMAVDYETGAGRAPSRTRDQVEQRLKRRPAAAARQRKSRRPHTAQV